MKCEKCGKNEATFFYSANINGEKSERHLCADCAREEGFGGALEFERPMGMLDGFFDDMFSDFFAPARALLPDFGMFGSPVRRIMASTGTAAARRTEPLTEVESRIPADAGGEIRSRRELEALKAQLADAVQAEDFEKAITLRDQIRKIEG